MVSAKKGIAHLKHVGRQDGKLWEEALLNVMSCSHDLGLLRLSEDLPQVDDGNHAGLDGGREHSSWSHGSKLIYITCTNAPCACQKQLGMYGFVLDLQRCQLQAGALMTLNPKTYFAALSLLHGV